LVPNEVLVLAIVAVGAVDVALLGALVAPAVRRRLPGRESHRSPVFEGEPLDLQEATAIDPESIFSDGVPAAAYDRVARITSWAFILTTAMVVTSTGLWPDRQAAILGVLGVAGIFVLITHDVMPTGALGRWKYLIEGTLAVFLVTLIVILTGGATSPFFFAFAVVAAGAALVLPQRSTVVFVTIVACGYLVAAGVAAATRPLPLPTVALVGINLAALVLIAYVAMAIAREQRQTRNAAVRLSTLDPLTGLANRAFFLAAVEREIARSRRYGRGFCLLMADLDDLKLINDTYGHRVGDHALIGVAGVIREGLRQIDTAARLGGDEFVVLLPETDPTGAFVVAEKIRQAGTAVELGDRETPIRVGVSIGLVGWPDDGETVAALMAAVDDAMYVSKRRGKNRVGGRGAFGGPPGGAPRLTAPARVRAEGEVERVIGVPVAAANTARPR
jgi:diguanylate cyclase (GGDEF)-like protein